MSARLWEAVKSAFACAGFFVVLTAVFGGITFVEPNAGWSSFISGALWLGVPAAIGIARYVRGAA